MRHLLARNWKDAISEVLASLIGTVGVTALISFVLSLQSSAAGLAAIFGSYFSAGQLGLPILALSGVIFIALRRHGEVNPLVAVGLYIVLVLPTIVTAFVVGMNPGFRLDVLSSSTVSVLWALFMLLHALWLTILLLRPALPSPQEADEEEAERVDGIKRRASDRG